MCKKTNIFFLTLLIWYIATALAVAIFLGFYNQPYWVRNVENYVILMFPAILYLLICNINPFKTMAFKLLKPMDILLAVVFGILLLPLVMFINAISLLFVDNAVTESAAELAYTYSTFIGLLLVSVMPAVCEEFLFRGIIFHGLRKNSFLTAVIMSGIAFGIFHLNFNQFFYATALGIVFAFLVEATSSLFSSIIVHMTINSYSILSMMNLSKEEIIFQLEESGNQLENFRKLPAVQLVIIYAGLFLFAAFFATLAFMVFRLLAKRNNRWEYIKSRMKNGFKSMNDEKSITAPYVVAIVIGVAFMIITK